MDKHTRNGRLKANLGLFVVSLVISLVLWAFVAWDGNSDGHALCPQISNISTSERVLDV